MSRFKWNEGINYVNICGKGLGIGNNMCKGFEVENEFGVLGKVVKVVDVCRFREKEEDMRWRGGELGFRVL